MQNIFLEKIHNILVTDDGRNIIQRYGWHIVFTFLTIYYLRESVLSPYLQKRTQEQTYKEVTDPKHVESHREKMLRVRQLQQKQVQTKSNLAMEVRKQKEKVMKKDSRVMNQQKERSSSSNSLLPEDEDDEKEKRKKEYLKKKKEKKKLHSGKAKSNPYKNNDYNPMAPSGTGTSYRPAKRKVGGGGG